MPMKVVEIHRGESGDEGVGELGGVRRAVSFQLLEGIELGDYVLVHAGFAIAKVDEEDAQESIVALEDCGIDG
jgi:hydrogenase expression/formation protein HypC